MTPKESRDFEENSAIDYRKLRIVNAKRELYHLLLEVPAGKLTVPEVDTAYALACDPDIQRIIEERLKKR